MSKYEIQFSKNFQKSLSKLENKSKKQIQSAITNFLTSPKTANIKKLEGYTDLFRLRSGDYRIIFKETNEKIEILTIIFLDVKHRKDVYRNL